jgi:hypothetical protein
MFWLRLIYSRLNGLLRKNRIEQEMDDEMRFHLLMRTRDNIERGMRPNEAEREARRRFGNVGRIKDLARDIKGGGFMETLLQDLRYGARMLWKNPGFTLIAVITLALGIGANTAIFSLVNALLLRPLSGVDDPERLVQVGRQYSDKSYLSDSSYPDYLDYREQNTVMSGLALLAPTSFHLSTGQEAERVEGEWVSGNFFDVLGVRPAHGRLITPIDEQGASASQVAVLSYRLWRHRFGGGPECHRQDHQTGWA